MFVLHRTHTHVGHLILTRDLLKLIFHYWAQFSGYVAEQGDRRGSYGAQTILEHIRERD
jgi:hypothetical protein